jgi:hypothetical protein
MRVPVHIRPHPSAAAIHDSDRLQIVGCPEPGCGVPAGIYDDVVLASTDGPIAHVRTACVAGHWLFLPREAVMS